MVYNLKILTDFFPVKQMMHEKGIETVEEYVGRVAKTSCQGIFDDTREYLSIDDQVRLIDQYFHGQGYALLGVLEPGPWQTPEDFFQL